MNVPLTSSVPFDEPACLCPLELARADMAVVGARRRIPGDREERVRERRGAEAVVQRAVVVEQARRAAGLRCRGLSRVGRGEIGRRHRRACGETELPTVLAWIRPGVTVADGILEPGLRLGAGPRDVELRDRLRSRADVRAAADRQRAVDLEIRAGEVRAAGDAHRPLRIERHVDRAAALRASGTRSGCSNRGSSRSSGSGITCGGGTFAWRRQRG